MSISWAYDVEVFHKKFDIPLGTQPALPEILMRSEREALLDEEVQELKNAEDITAFVDANLDLIYVALGNLLVAGIPAQTVQVLWHEVHRSNLDKIKSGDQPGAKPRKPASWNPPDLTGILQSLFAETQFDSD